MSCLQLHCAGRRRLKTNNAVQGCCASMCRGLCLTIFASIALVLSSVGILVVPAQASIFLWQGISFAQRAAHVRSRIDAAKSWTTVNATIVNVSEHSQRRCGESSCWTDYWVEGSYMYKWRGHRYESNVMQIASKGGNINRLQELRRAKRKHKPVTAWCADLRLLAWYRQCHEPSSVMKFLAQ